ncbi:MAG: hypothetical protein RIE52_12045 [Balneola sp.]
MSEIEKYLESMPDEELIKEVEALNKDLKIKGMSAYRMSIPPLAHDSDCIIFELIRRYKLLIETND